MPLLRLPHCHLRLRLICKGAVHFIVVWKAIGPLPRVTREPLPCLLRLDLQEL